MNVHKSRKGVDPDERGDRGKLGVEKGETVIMIY